MGVYVLYTFNCIGMTINIFELNFELKTMTRLNAVMAIVGHSCAITLSSDALTSREVLPLLLLTWISVQTLKYISVTVSPKIDGF